MTNPEHINGPKKSKLHVLQKYKSPQYSNEYVQNEETFFETREDEEIAALMEEFQSPNR